MPIHKLGPKQFQWGTKGKVYKTRKQAERQAKTAYMNGYRPSRQDLLDQLYQAILAEDKAYKRCVTHPTMANVLSYKQAMKKRKRVASQLAET